MNPRTIMASVLTVSVAAVVLAACATPIGDDAGDGLQILPDPPPASIPAPGEVLGQGTVIQTGSDAAMLCLGAVAESYPPQCSGPEIDGWDWSTVEGTESSNGVTWGTYVVQGDWDGERFALTQPPVMLALYDPMPIEQPLLEPANAGTTDEARLLAIQSEVHSTDGVPVLSSSPNNGYLFLDVVYDDGQIQRYFDQLYGERVVVVQSALRPATP